MIENLPVRYQHGWLCTCLADLRPRVNQDIMDCPECGRGWPGALLVHASPLRWPKVDRDTYLEQLRERIRPDVWTKLYDATHNPGRKPRITPDDPDWQPDP